ncbi:MULTISPECIES: YjjG family noncanonical pyrimidine nucleotidase [unclassified Lentimicrobium]|uniref:YjjG family noncanonical pyrimidine nucleotidase n=1 Tax=unclassified Lentimicrobium TaxID=2677434 RepID=UPI00155625C9|nr:MULTISPECIES: YjjG family noncanonical pyrimidine nucleotidase [unclassified Lentimicrobium]NPD44900.1 noncanonical pyrimidine nucleotidase, YjjG family [Lentimicrobium sp. S6]NPD83726.1 noncanonical pyrimidine nucleotidase, YjjG family [Lentimicrobium sp. L6]
MTAKKYKYLFFDLDRTLWDFEKNSVLTLKEIYEEARIGDMAIIDFADFHTFYVDYNHHLWDLYKDGKIEKDYLSVQRFRGSLQHFKIDDEDLAIKMAKDYVRISPTKTALFPNAILVLKNLSKRYSMHIITNGFNEVQFVKLDNSGLTPYFEQIITSEMVGVQKPHRDVFDFAMKQAGASAEESLMIGDDQVSDIQGARNAHIDQVFVDFHHEDLRFAPTFHIHSLSELLNFL